jgi:hypothetical protein
MKKYFCFFILSILAFTWVACAKEESTTDMDKENETPIISTLEYTAIKTGTFNGANGYPSNGKAVLGQDKAGTFYIILEKDFSTSFATGAVTMYLSKTAQPNFTIKESFIKLAVISKSGFHAFKLTAKPSDDLINVVVWCEPAGVKFGHAELK